MDNLSLIIFGIAAFTAGIMNTLAGGGSFVTFPALLMTGLDARAANITSTLALFPMQLSAGYAGRKMAGGTAVLSFKALFIISLIGGAIGGGLLLLTPSHIFARMVPWLILFATVMFAWGSFFKKPKESTEAPHFGPIAAGAIQFCIGIYGGYFGGGIGFLMLAGLTLAGMSIRKAGTTKNILAGVMNASAVVIFLFSHDIGWVQVGIGACASVLGGLLGVRILHKVNERILRIAVVTIGTLLTIAMFLRS